MNELLHQVELMIDEHGLTAVVDSICEVCYLKAEHIRASYTENRCSNNKLAQQWEQSGKSLVNSKIEVEFPS